MNQVKTFQEKKEVREWMKGKRIHEARTKSKGYVTATADYNWIKERRQNERDWHKYRKQAEAEAAMAKKHRLKILMKAWYRVLPSYVKEARAKKKAADCIEPGGMVAGLMKPSESSKSVKFHGIQKQKEEVVDEPKTPVAAPGSASRKSRLSSGDSLRKMPSARLDRQRSWLKLDDKNGSSWTPGRQPSPSLSQQSSSVKRANKQAPSLMVEYRTTTQYEQGLKEGLKKALQYNTHGKIQGDKTSNKSPIKQRR